MSRAPHAVTGCTTTYLAQFAEAEGFAHVHFHIVPRMPDQRPEHRGPNVFALMGVADPVPVERMDELAVALAAALR